jgi:hypothetical protein
MVDWELTATTVYCESVGDEVTLLVTADGACRCTGRRKYGPDDEKAVAKQPKGRQSGRPVCAAAECAIIVRYREKLFGDEGPRR